MSHNTFGKLFRVTTFGESHGPAIGCVIDGCPPRLLLSPADIEAELAHRRPGVQAHATSRREPDKVEILSGVFDGQTTGTPISLIIYNRDVKSHDYDELRHVFRPGHGDFTYQAKYGIRDHRGGGRASARETAARVAAGAVAQKVLDPHHIHIIAFTREFGGVRAQRLEEAAIWDNPFACPDPDAVAAAVDLLSRAAKPGIFVGWGARHVADDIRRIAEHLGAPVATTLQGLAAFPADHPLHTGMGFGPSSVPAAQNAAPALQFERTR